MTLDLSLTQLGFAGLLVLIAMALTTWQKLGVAKSLAVGAIRASVQLTLMGYVLVTVFESADPFLTVGLILVMTAIAAYTASGRQKTNTADRKLVGGYAFLSILLSSAFTLSFVSVLVVQPDPWYSAQYLIPLAGMIIANSMNAAALGAERFASELRTRRAEVETLLALGADLRTACKDLVRTAVSAAMMPTVSGLMVVGLVSLPGMMSGQILSGVSPLLAVRYQLVVQFMIACSAALTSTAIVTFYGHSFFDRESQSLKLERILSN